MEESARLAIANELKKWGSLLAFAPFHTSSISPVRGFLILVHALSRDASLHNDDWWLVRSWFGVDTWHHLCAPIERFHDSLRKVKQGLEPRALKHVVAMPFPAGARNVLHDIKEVVSLYSFTLGNIWGHYYHLGMENIIGLHVSGGGFFNENLWQRGASCKRFIRRILLAFCRQSKGRIDEFLDHPLRCMIYSVHTMIDWTGEEVMGLSQHFFLFSSEVSGSSSSYTY